MKRLAVWVAVFVLVLPMATAAQPVVDPIDFDLDGMLGVAEPPAGVSPEPEARTQGSARLLIDRSHGQDVSISGFTDFLESEGWVVEELDPGPVSDSVLAPYDVFLVPIRLSSPMAVFAPSEVAAVTGFVAGGGGLWLFHETLRDPSGINSVAAEFGVLFQNDYVRDPSNNEGQLFWPTIYLLAKHPITQGVASYGYYSGCCLIVGAPSAVIGMGDDDAYSAACPSFPPTLAAFEDVGRVVFSGDIVPLSEAYYPERLRDEEELLLQNIANWLLGPPPNGVESETWGKVKARFR